MTPLTDLLRRAEGASGPDRELDADILAALLDASRERGYRNANAMRSKGCADLPARDYWRRHGPLVTSSVDAALALVERVLPPAWVRLDSWYDDSKKVAAILPKPTPNEVAGGIGTTLPLAVLAALLKALIAREPANTAPRAGAPIVGGDGE